MSISVRVTLFGALGDAVGRSELTLALPDGAVVRDVVLACGLEDRVDIWALVDGRRAERDVRLTDGACVALHQPVGGG